jgi:hypothetical protein
LDDICPRESFSQAMASVRYTASWGVLSTTEQEQVVTLVRFRLPSKSLVRLLAHLGVLRARDRDGHTTLDNLVDLAREPLSPALLHAFVKTYPARLAREGYTQEQADQLWGGISDWEGRLRRCVLWDMVDELVTPGRVDQGPTKQCGEAAAQRALLRWRPAEFARVMAGLVSLRGSVALMGRQTLSLQTRSMRADSRVLPDILFQDAASAFLGERPQRNTSNEGERRLVSALFGRAYRVGKYDAQGDSSGAGLVQALQEAQARGASTPVLVLIRGKEDGHFLQFDHCTKARVYLENSWGALGPEDNYYTKQYGGRIEDRTKDIVSYTPRELAQRVRAIFAAQG